jgi:hypothetical protein
METTINSVLVGAEVPPARNSHFSVSNVSKPKDLGIIEIEQLKDLQDEIHALAKGSSFPTFERVVFGTAFALPDQLIEDPSLVLTDVSNSGESVKLTDVPVAAVPEPSTYVLMFGSMSIISSTARRRRNDAVGWMASRRREDVVA